MNKRISYVALISDMYMLIILSNIVYGIFFGFDRIGNASLTIIDINKNTAIIIAIIEIVIGLITTYLLHKCTYISVRIILIILCILNIIYRIINLLRVVNPFTILMLLVSVVLLIILLLYKKD